MLLKSIRHRLATAPVQVVVAASMVSYGLAFLNPLTDAFGQNRNYAAMAAIANEATFGLFFVVAGGSWLAGVALGYRWLADAGALMTLVSRSTVFLLVGTGSNWQSPGVSDFFFWVVLCLIADWRRAHRRRHL